MFASISLALREREMFGQTNKQTDGQRNKWTDLYMFVQANKQTDGQRNRRTDEHKHIYILELLNGVRILEASQC